jgi:hypothetical protein
MKKKELDYSAISYHSFREQLRAASKKPIQEVDAATTQKVADLTQQKAKLQVQIALLQKKAADMQAQIDKLEGKKP